MEEHTLEMERLRRELIHSRVSTGSLPGAASPSPPGSLTPASVHSASALSDAARPWLHDQPTLLPNFGAASRPGLREFSVPSATVLQPPGSFASTVTVDEQMPFSLTSSPLHKPSVAVSSEQNDQPVNCDTKSEDYNTHHSVGSTPESEAKLGLSSFRSQTSHTEGSRITERNVATRGDQSQQDPAGNAFSGLAHGSPTGDHAPGPQQDQNQETGNLSQPWVAKHHDANPTVKNLARTHDQKLSSLESTCDRTDTVSGPSLAAAHLAAAKSPRTESSTPPTQVSGVNSNAKGGDSSHTKQIPTPRLWSWGDDSQSRDIPVESAGNQILPRRPVVLRR